MRARKVWRAVREDQLRKVKGAQGIPTYAPSMEERVGACRPCPHARGIRKKLEAVTNS